MRRGASTPQVAAPAAAQAPHPGPGGGTSAHQVPSLDGFRAFLPGPEHAWAPQQYAAASGSSPSVRLPEHFHSSAVLSSVALSEEVQGMDAGAGGSATAPASQARAKQVQAVALAIAVACGIESGRGKAAPGSPGPGGVERPCSGPFPVLRQNRMS